MFIEISVLILIFLILLTSISNFVSVFCVFKKIKKQNCVSVNPTSSNCKLNIVIPCLREQAVIESTLDYFIKITKQVNPIHRTPSSFADTDYDYPIN